jgi:hypothetical protein
MPRSLCAVGLIPRSHAHTNILFLLARRCKDGCFPAFDGGNKSSTSHPRTNEPVSRARFIVHAHEQRVLATCFSTFIVARSRRSVKKCFSWASRSISAEYKYARLVHLEETLYSSSASATILIPFLYSLLLAQTILIQLTDTLTGTFHTETTDTTEQTPNTQASRTNIVDVSLTSPAASVSTGLPGPASLDET